MEPSGPGSSPSNYPRPGLDQDRQNLREIASALRQIMYCILGQFVIVALDIASNSGRIFALVLVTGLLALCVLVYELISVSKLARALGLSPVIYVILMFIPCVSLIFLLLLSQKATTRLKAAGIKVGLMGADPNSI
jgi:hypothetical protein